MASTDLSAALPAPAHPMAKSGFGKRTARVESDGRRPDTLTDFAHLPPREAYLAAYIDRLPEGAAIDVKTLAKAQPLYGQQAVRSALRELSRVGHLRRVGGLAGGATVQHVTRTYFSRSARDESWWTGFLDVRPYAAGSDGAPEEPPRESSPRAHRSEAYEALAALGQRDPRLLLSATECAELEPLAAQWCERGVRGAQFAYVMTSGLPSDVHSPAGLLRRRLTDKLPPEPGPVRQEPGPRSASPRWRLECTDCGVPGDPAALPGGLCRRCRDEPSSAAEQRPGLSGAEVRDWAMVLRDAAGRPRIGKHGSTMAARGRGEEST